MNEIVASDPPNPVHRPSDAESRRRRRPARKKITTQRGNAANKAKEAPTTIVQMEDPPWRTPVEDSLAFRRLYSPFLPPQGEGRRSSPESLLQKWSNFDHQVFFFRGRMGVPVAFVAAACFSAAECFPAGTVPSLLQPRLRSAPVAKGGTRVRLRIRSISMGGRGDKDRRSENVEGSLFVDNR